jgi:hypothetical protein
MAKPAIPGASPEPLSKIMAVYGDPKAQVKVVTVSVKKRDGGRVNMVEMRWTEDGQRRRLKLKDNAQNRAHLRQGAQQKADELRRIKSEPRPTEATLRTAWGYYESNSTFARIAPATQAMYRAGWQRFERLAGGSSVQPEALEFVDLDAIWKAMLSEVMPATAKLAFKAAKIVLRYCYSRKLIARFPFEGYRASLTPDDRARKYLPAAYSPEDVQLMLRQISPQSKRDWRIHSLLQFQSTQGPRIEQVCSVVWENVFLQSTDKYPWGYIRWPALGTGNKTREYRVQPLLPDGRAALLTAKWWNDQRETPSKWVWPAARAEYRSRPKGDLPFAKGSFIAALHRLERKAGIARKGWRASHGLRRHAAIMFYYLSGRSVKAAMDWIGDSIDRADDYLRDEMGGVLEAVGDVEAVLKHAVYVRS